MTCGFESFAFGTILNCEPTEEACRKFLALAVVGGDSHSPEAFIGVERCDGEQRNQVLSKDFESCH